MKGVSRLLWYLLLIHSLSYFFLMIRMAKGNGLQNQRPLHVRHARHKADSLRTQESAQQVCKQKGQVLPSMVSLEDYYLVSHRLSRGRKNSTWLNIKRKPLGSWAWVDGTTSNLLTNKKKFECGFIDSNSPTVRATECSALWLGYICQRRGSQEHCPDLHVGTKQVKAGRGCYVIYMEKVNWFEARSRCSKTNLDFAVIEDLQAQKELRTKIGSYWDIFRQYYYWIGLRNTDWQMLEPFKDMFSMFWDWREPNATGDCVRAIKSKKMYAWRVTPCAEKHQFICVESTHTSKFWPSGRLDPSLLRGTYGSLFFRKPSQWPTDNSRWSDSILLGSSIDSYNILHMKCWYNAEGRPGKILRNH